MDEKVEEMFTPDFTNAPAITVTAVARYLISEIADADQRSRQAFKSYNDRRLSDDGQVFEVGFMKHGDFGIYRGKVVPTQKQETFFKEDHYICWSAVDCRDCLIRLSYCQCLGG